MKKCSLLLVVFCLCLPLIATAQEINTIDINADQTYQTMDGFGAAIAWYENWLTAHPKKSDIYDLIFKDLNLDILRLRNIYGYDDYTFDDAKEIVGQADESLGRPIDILLSSWSPPANLKKNNVTHGGTLLKTDGQFVYDDFAKWWVDSVAAYRDAGIVPTYISMQNEPDYENSGWETCIFKNIETTDYPGYGTALEALYDQFKGLADRPQIVGAEVTGVGYYNFQNYVDHLNRDHLDAYAYHLYNGGDAGNPDSFSANLAPIKASYGDKPNMMTEYSGGSGNWFTKAWLIQNCLTDADASAYLYWDLIWGDSGGMVTLENPWSQSAWTTADGYKVNGDYYSIKHFSKYILKGYRRVGASSDDSNLRTSAFISPDGGKLTIVVLNVAANAETAKFAFTGFNATAVVGFQSADNHFDQPVSSLTPSGAITLPAKTVTTLQYTMSSEDVPEEFPVTGITISDGDIELKSGQTHQLSADIQPEDATDPSVTWSSSDTNVASVNANGVVTGVAPGNATITATTSNGGFMDTITVTVNDEAVQPQAGGLKLQMVNGTKTAQINTINPRFKLINTGDAAIDLSAVKMRYYYTIDGEKAQQFWCDWSQAGSADVTGTFIKMPTPVTGADHYLEVGFTSAAGTLAVGQGIDIHARIAKSDWTNYDQSDDYSFNKDASDYEDWAKVTAYISGTLQWGNQVADAGDDGGDDNGDTAEELTISPTTATFDKNVANQADIVVTLLGDNSTLDAISDGSTELVKGSDYTVSNRTVTLLKSYLAAQAVGTLNLIFFDYGTGSHPELTLEVIDTTAADGEADTTPPTAPTDLKATNTTGNSVSLVWTAASDNVGVTGYDVYNGGILAATVTTTSATVTDLVADTTYNFTVTARDAADNISPESEILNVITAAADDETRHQAAYPEADPSDCGNWALVDNVCVPQYCADDDRSESCDACGGNDSPNCVTVDSKGCISGEWPEVHAVSDDEPWHYSRSTHYGLTSGGACGFGLYGLCTSRQDFTDANLASQCDAFCKAYPQLCADPADTTLRGNFAAPQGNYYTQFWPSLPGDRDNYLSCGECYEVSRTKKDGSEYQPGEEGYTQPVTLQLTDSCPCSANSKWCCGSGRDHCGEVSDFTYGCQPAGGS